MLHMTLTRWFVALTLAMLTAVPAFAQEIGRAPEKSMWQADILAIFFLVCVAVVSFMSSKRGHQD